jgi:hypothetical protein
VAILDKTRLSSAKINLETLKGEVQLSGFVNPLAVNQRSGCGGTQRMSHPSKPQCLAIRREIPAYWKNALLLLHEPYELSPYRFRNAPLGDAAD